MDVCILRRRYRAVHVGDAEKRDLEVSGRFDAVGAVLTVVLLGALTYALTPASTAPAVLVAGLVALAIAALAGFLVAERRHGSPAGAR